MSRRLMMTLAVALIAASGCATVRGTYTACFSSPCLPDAQSNAYSKNYNPIPEHGSVEESPVPAIEMEEAEEEIPPPPPEALDAAWFNAKPLRTPVLPPVKDSTVRWSQKFVENFKS